MGILLLPIRNLKITDQQGCFHVIHEMEKQRKLESCSVCFSYSNLPNSRHVARELIDADLVYVYFFWQLIMKVQIPIDTLTLKELFQEKRGFRFLKIIIQPFKDNLF
jgi:hypothetical protein